MSSFSECKARFLQCFTFVSKPYNERINYFAIFFVRVSSNGNDLCHELIMMDIFKKCIQ